MTSPNGKALSARSLLGQYELARRLAERERLLGRKSSLLEALHRVGVTLAASFDIDSILEQVAEAAKQLVGDVPIDVFYAGSFTIQAVPRWLPCEPGPGNLPLETRLSMEHMVRGCGQTTAISDLEKEICPLGDGTPRLVVPIGQNAEILGLMLIEAGSALEEDERELLGILSLQAATALRNIHLNQQRIRVERLAAFGQMIGSLVHDFRSPLTVVRGYMGMLGEPDLASDKRGELARLALEECDRLNSMIEELLDFTRGGRVELRRSLLELDEYLSSLRPAIEAQFAQSGIRFEMNLGYHGPLLLDPDRMSRAVLNIVSNARQAMNGSGVLSIRTERRGNEVVVEFEDTGSGIPEDIRHRIFEPFFSFGKSQGIGLGMSIAKKIVEEHGGSIGLTSEEGRGTKVQFFLPIEPSPSGAG